MKEIYIIVATDKENGIGLNGTMPWNLSGEIQHFAKTTKEAKENKENAVIMGRTTWVSLPEKYRPLPERKNFVLTRQSNFQAEGAEVCSSLEKALDIANNDQEIDKIFIIGGGQLYKEALNALNITGIYQTRIEEIFDCDTFFPLPKMQYNEAVLGSNTEKGVSYTFVLLTPLK